MRRLNFFLDEKQIIFLENLPGTLSENVRRAIDDYMQKHQSQKVSASVSVMEDKKNG